MYAYSKLLSRLNFRSGKLYCEKGTGLRPVLEALTPDEAAEFQSEYGQRLRAAYPAQPYGTVLPFRRVFMVAQRAG